MYKPIFLTALLAASLSAQQGMGRRAAQTPTAPIAAAPAQVSPAAPPNGSAALERFSATKHSITINGKTIPYTATAGTLVLKNDQDRPTASIFFVAYTRDDQQDKTKWPVTFTFNGGPGSSSVWLHMGALGPRRVAMANAEGEQPAPPFHLVDNEDTGLTVTDLVFIDPVTTGFSRPAPGESASNFHGFDGDLQSVADFIRLYLVKFDRWSSPKFLAGESYGTMRAAGLSQVLLNQHGIYLNGISFISTVLNFGTINFDPGNELPYVLFLPTYTATAWYHKKLTGTLQSNPIAKTVEEARKFALGEYATALMRGDSLPPAEKAKMVQQLARFTGLPPKYIEESNLRVPIQRFTKELLRDQRTTVGRYDSRLKGADADAAGERGEYDPSYAAVQGAYTAAFNDYVRNELKWETDLTYEILTGKVQPWNYSRFTNSYVTTANMLRSAMTQNPAMKVMFHNGYYDLATPFGATEYVVDHLGLEPAVRGNVKFTYCEAGHMLYMKKSCLDTLHETMEGLYKSALPAR